jgi:hypothetical protein
MALMLPVLSFLHRVGTAYSNILFSTYACLLDFMFVQLASLLNSLGKVHTEYIYGKVWGPIKVIARRVTAMAVANDQRDVVSHNYWTI